MYRSHRQIATKLRWWLRKFLALVADMKSTNILTNSNNNNNKNASNDYSHFPQREDAKALLMWPKANLEGSSIPRQGGQRLMELSALILWALFLSLHRHRRGSCVEVPYLWWLFIITSSIMDRVLCYRRERIIYRNLASLLMGTSALGLLTVMRWGRILVEWHFSRGKKVVNSWFYAAIINHQDALDSPDLCQWVRNDSQ